MMETGIVLVLVVVVNIFASALMAYDKRAARRRRWRIPEASLFLLALMGATPAIYVAMRRLRHKTAKPPFVWRMHLIALLQLMGLVWFWIA